MNANSSSAQRTEALKNLSQLVEPGNTVYTILRHVSRSGMSRSISLKVVKDGEIVELDYFVSRVLGNKWDKDNGGLKIGGSGMDMGFELVYRLSIAMFCPDKYDHDKAFSLKQRWL